MMVRMKKQFCFAGTFLFGSFTDWIIFSTEFLGFKTSENMGLGFAYSVEKTAEQTWTRLKIECKYVSCILACPLIAVGVED